MAAMRITNTTNLTGGYCPPILGGAILHPLFFNFGPGGNALKLPTVVHILLPTKGFRLVVYLHVFIRHCVTLVVFQVLLCAQKGIQAHPELLGVILFTDEASFTPGRCK